MGRKKLVQKLKVYLGSTQIGNLIKQTNGAVEFNYLESWIENGYAISLSLPLADKSFKGDKASFYFDNLLPDNTLILKAIAKKVHAASIQQFDLLGAIGRECVGALSFFPEDDEPIFQNKMQSRLLTEERIAQRIQGLASVNPLGMDDDAEFRLSLAGAQEKMALLFFKEKWYEPRGQTPTSHIIKKKMGKLAGNLNFESSVENEMSCLFLAKKFGIDACDAEIVNFCGEEALVVKRFDRVWDKQILRRKPQEDFCQATGVSPKGKYEKQGGPSIQTIMQILLNSNNADEDRKTFFKTMLFNDLIFNTDMHGKNASIFITDKGFYLTPMYDLLSAHFIKVQSEERYQKLRSNISVNGKFTYNQIDLGDWKAEADACKVSEELFREICDELRATVKSLTYKDRPSTVKEAEFKIIIDGLRHRAKSLLGS